MFFPQYALQEEDEEEENNSILTQHAFWRAFRRQLSLLNQAITVRDVADGATANLGDWEVDEEHISFHSGEQEPYDDHFLRSTLVKFRPVLQMYLISAMNDYTELSRRIKRLKKKLQANDRAKRELMANDSRMVHDQDAGTKKAVSVDSSEDDLSPLSDNDGTDGTMDSSSDSHGGSTSFTVLLLTN